MVKRCAVVLALLLWPAFAFGGTDYDWVLTDICGVQGDVESTTLSLEFADGAEGIAGWQVSVCHDETRLTLDAITSLELGNPAFEGIVDEGASGYWSVGVVVSLSQDETLDEGGDAYEVAYLLGEVGETVIEVCDEGLDLDGVSVVVGVESEIAGGNTADVKILSPLTFRALTGCGSYDVRDGIGSGSISIEIEDVGVVPEDINGFTIALSNDDDEIEPTGGVVGTGVDEPDFFSVSVTASTCVAAVIYNLTDLSVTQSFENPIEVLTVNYDTNPDFESFDGTDDPVVTAIEFESTDIIDNQLASVVEGVVITILPNLEDGTIEWGTDGCGSEGFRRGDCDGNGTVFPILDAVYLLEYGFNDGPVPGCLAAADCDGNGVVFAILDALYILEYGFTNGPAPPSPGPTVCGLDTNSPGPGCETPPDGC